MCTVHYRRPNLSRKKCLNQTCLAAESVTAHLRAPRIADKIVQLTQSKSNSFGHKVSTKYHNRRQMGMISRNSIPPGYNNRVGVEKSVVPGGRRPVTTGCKNPKGCDKISAAGESRPGVLFTVMETGKPFGRILIL